MVQILTHAQLQYIHNLCDTLETACVIHVASGPHFWEIENP